MLINVGTTKKTSVILDYRLNGHVISLLILRIDKGVDWFPLCAK
jgi:hypothetical protein